MTTLDQTLAKSFPRPMGVHRTADPLAHYSPDCLRAGLDRLLDDVEAADANPPEIPESSELPFDLAAKGRSMLTDPRILRRSTEEQLH